MHYTRKQLFQIKQLIWYNVGLGYEIFMMPLLIHHCITYWSYNSVHCFNIRFICISPWLHFNTIIPLPPITMRQSNAQELHCYSHDEYYHCNYNYKYNDQYHSNANTNSNCYITYYEETMNWNYSVLFWTWLPWLWLLSCASVGLSIISVTVLIIPVLYT